MKNTVKTSLKAYAIEITLYAALVVGYYWLVLHFLGDWIYRIFEQNRKLYAGVALGLILAQGFLLELLTRFLLGWLKPGTEEE